jgi:long-subunit fatty acid transport protein
LRPSPPRPARPAPRLLRRSACAAPLAAVVLGLPGLAAASGYYFSDVGTRGMARAGAFVASVDDLSAQYYNPAGLVRLGRPQAYVNHSMVWQSVDFNRAPDQQYVIDKNPDGTYATTSTLTDTTYDTVNNELRPMHIPAFGVSHNFGLKNTMFALGLFPPFAPRMTYPDDGAQRYSLRNSLVVQFYAGPSVAHRFLDGKVTVGAGVYWTYIQADQALDITICSTRAATDVDCSNPAYPINDLSIDVAFKDPRRVTWNAGIMIDPIEELTIGLSVQPPLKVAGQGTIEADFHRGHWMTEKDPNDPVEGNPTQLGIVGVKGAKDDNVSVALTMPWLIRGGVSVHPSERWDVEVATVWQRWSMTEEIRVSDVNLKLPVTETFKGLGLQDFEITDDIVLPADYVNAWSYRVGGDYAVVDKGEHTVVVRGGGLYETSAIPGNTQSVALVDGNKVGMGLGGTYQFRNRVAFDVGFSRTWILEREITDSEVTRQEVPINFQSALANPESLSVALVPGQTVGNGSFASKLAFLSAGVTYKFGKHNKDL